MTPGADELRARAHLLALGVSYGHEPTPLPTPTPTPAPAAEAGEGEGEGEGAVLEDAPAAQEPAAAPAGRRSAPRLPDWWEEHKPLLSVRDETPPAAPAPADPAEDDTAAEEDQAPEDTPTKDTEDTGDTGDAEDTGEEDREEDPEDTAPASKIPPMLSRWRRAPRLRRRPAFVAPGIPYADGRDRRSLAEVIRSTPPHIRWLAYSGSALAVGWKAGWPQWVRDSVAYLATHEPSWTTSYCLTCYALAAGVLVLDYRARRWPLPLAWAARIPSASLVVGVLLYGDPTPISQTF